MGSGTWVLLLLLLLSGGVCILYVYLIFLVSRCLFLRLVPATFFLPRVLPGLL